MKRTSLSLAHFLAIVTLALAACDKPSSPGASGAAALVPIQVQLNWVPEPEFGGMYAALQDGLYSQAGMNVELIKGGGQVPCAQLVASGRVPFALVSAEEVLTMRARGGSIVGVFATFQENPMAFLLHEANPINTLEQLWRSNSMVGVNVGLPYVTILNEKYSGAGLKLVPYSGGLATFLVTPDSAQQCFIASEPVECRVRGVPVKIISMAEAFNPYAAVVATNEAFLKQNPAVVEAFVQATQEGWRRYLATPQKYNPAIVALNPSMSLEAMNIAAEIERSSIEPAAGKGFIGEMTAARWEALGKQLVACKVIDVCPPVHEAFVAPRAPAPSPAPAPTSAP